MIALDDEYEKLLRMFAQEKYGGKKGSLSEVVQEALDRMKDRSLKEKIVEFREMLKTGLHFKYKMYRHRSEIYE